MLITSGIVMLAVYLLIEGDKIFSPGIGRLGGQSLRFSLNENEERRFAMSTNTQRVVIFFLAGTATIVAILVQGFSLDSTFIYWFVVVGIEGLIIYELMYRTQNLVRWITLPIYGIAFLIVEALIDTFVSGYLYDFSAFDSIGRIETYTQYFTTPSLLIPSSIVLLTAFFLNAQNTIALPRLGKVGSQTGASEKVMLEISDDLVTRLLCASAITQGAAFRKMVLDRVENQYTGVAPEFGLDLELVTGVCQFVERRETKFQIAFFIAGLASILLSGFSPLMALVPMIVFTAPIMFIKIYNEKFDLLKDFMGADYNHGKAKSRYAIEKGFSVYNALPRSDQNLIVYSGFSPFVGAGFDLGEWSFALDVSRPKNELGLVQTVEEFEINDLYEEIEEACTNLNLPNLRVADLYFVSGSDIRNDRTILPNPLGKPIQHLDKDDVKSTDDFRIRQYKHLSVSTWGNDIIFSIFLRCAKRGRTLFVEAARYLLPPVDVRYRNLNRAEHKSWSVISGIAFSSLVLGPIDGYFIWLSLLGKLNNFISQMFGTQDRKLQNEIRENSNFNYGVASSLRQNVTGSNYLHYFQKSDREMFVKILDNQILETLLNFLDEHNVDTSQLRERQTTILNSGVIGDVTAQSVAVGQGAQSVSNQQKSSRSKE